jgi:hypothetical protein
MPWYPGGPEDASVGSRSCSFADLPEEFLPQRCGQHAEKPRHGQQQDLGVSALQVALHVRATHMLLAINSTLAGISAAFSSGGKRQRLGESPGWRVFWMTMMRLLRSEDYGKAGAIEWSRMGFRYVYLQTSAWHSDLQIGSDWRRS